MKTEAWDTLLVKTEAKKVLNTLALSVSAVTNPPAPFSNRFFIFFVQPFTTKMALEVPADFDMLCKAQL